MAQKLFESGLIMILGCFLSVVLLGFLGRAMDAMVAALMKAGVYDVAPAWQTDPSMLINMFYLGCMLPALIGIVVAILRSQEKTGGAFTQEVGQEFEVEEY